MNLSLSLCLVGSAVAMIFLLWFTWRLGDRTVGLPLCYMISLASIHFVGAWVYTLPAFQDRASGSVENGFRECFFGVLAFVGGLLVAERVFGGNKRTSAPVSVNQDASTARADTSNDNRPMPVRRSRNHLVRPVSAQIPRAGVFARLPEKYILLGILSIVMLIPILKAIPSIGAVASCGAYLMVAGFCLVCWRAWVLERRLILLRWLAVALTFPFITMLGSGHIFYGFVAVVIMYAFVLVFYRPRWQGALGFLLVAYSGLSVYVAYMRDREELRGVVWGGAGYSERVKTFAQMFRNFEFFQPNNIQHLQRIDDRLNQNFLVGAAIAYIASDGAQYANGKTISEAVLSLVPRILWRGKPQRAGSPEVVSHYTGMQFSEGTSVGVGQVMEFYINFGRWGVVIGFFSFGVIIRLFDWLAARSLARGDSRGFVLWFLPGLSFLQVGGSLVEVTGTLAASFVMVIAVNHFVVPATEAGKVRAAVGGHRRRRRQTGPQTVSKLPDSPPLKP